MSELNKEVSEEISLETRKEASKEAEHKPKIVAIDDTKFICGALRAWLKDKYKVKTFFSGEEALAYLNKHDADLILLDYDMPYMNGHDVLFKIRANKHMDNVPVVFLTKFMDKRLEEEMLIHGASGYIRKPLDIDVLHRCIDEQLKINKEN